MIAPNRSTLPMGLLTLVAVGTLATTAPTVAQAAAPGEEAQDAAAPAASRTLPQVNALVPNFYYDDVEAAKDWYTNKLGFRTVVDLGWVAIVEVAPGMQIALVDGERGTLNAVEEKGALLVIETDALEQWYEHVSSIEGIEWYQYDHDTTRSRIKHGLMEHREIEEFRVVDPGGYIIEFFRWKPEYKPK